MEILVFGDIVVVDEINIGVVVKCWESYDGKKEGMNYDIYVRLHSIIKNYDSSKVERFRVRHKYLDETDLEYQNNSRKK